MSDHDSPGVMALRRAGYRLTSPRLVILDALENCGGHTTAAELLQAVTTRDPSIGRASVFRTLDLMVKLGIIWTTVQGGSTIHYMLMPQGHHHHIICTGCGLRVEFEDCVLGTLVKSLEERFGFQIEGHLLELYGRCPQCRQKPPLPEGADLP